MNFTGLDGGQQRRRGRQRMIGQLRESSPRRVGPYETLARLGAGGMGEVFLATPEPHEPGRPYEQDALVAVKAIRKDLAGDAGFRARFRREISVATSVDSPFVARLVAGDADAGQPWLATEYVPGPNLADAVRRHGPLPVAAVAALGAGVARALAAVHGAGALHRDLKPANVLLGADGPKLIDFGVARALGATTMTATGLLVGTPGFMSPEHVAGGRHVVAASDVFCLASVLAYAASGDDPFGDGPMAAVLYRVSRAEARLDGVPEELRELLAACLAREPGERPEPAEVAARLGSLRDGGGDGGGGDDDDGGGVPVPAAGWPATVLGDIADVRRDTAQLCASGHPLLPLPLPPLPDGPAHPVTQTPTWTPTAPDLPAHGLPTMSSAAPVAPAPPTPAPPPRQGPTLRRAVLVVAAVAVAGAVVGGLLALRGSDSGSGSGSEGGGQASGSTGGGPASPGAAKPSVSPARLIATAGVDASGGDDRNGHVPQQAAQRPEGWRPWKATYGHAPMSCAADTEAVVCLLTNGTYEARSAADGHRLWTSDGRTGQDDGSGGEAYISPSGAFFMPGDEQHPVVRGGTTVIAYKGRVQVRDSKSGDVRWTAGAPAGKKATSALLTDDHLIVSSEGATRGADGPTGATVQAFPVERGGDPVWTYDLSNETLSMAEQGNYTAVLAHDGLVYADSAKGVVALDEKKGDRVGGVFDDGQCRSLMADTRASADPGDDQILCTHVLGVGGDLDDPTADPQTRVSRLDARTLAVEGTFGFKAPPTGSDGHPGLDVVVSAVAPGAALAYDTTGAKLLVADPKTGRLVRKEPLSVVDYAIARPVSSGALVIGDRALTADNSTLRTVPLTAAGTVRTVRVPGAPGNRVAEPPADSGTVVADQPKPPTVLPLGGVATIVYDQGTVVSVELPS
ncbi:serine/threonine-protein kinase [Streptomyces sp. NPDC046465]|uniref:serine/threonine-protein kinase n=1 Tax=Streptomyces sp. NPDC046465 TaxID=3155810 RepID=UPI0033EC0467